MDLSRGRLLERLISANAFERQQPLDDMVVPENGWAASSLVFLFLEAAVPPIAPPDRAALQRAIDEGLGEFGSCRLEDLEAKQLVRLSLGIPGIPFGVSFYLARLERAEREGLTFTHHLEPPEEHALRAVKRDLTAWSRSGPWLSDAEARRLRDEHAAVHRDTPPIKGLVEAGLLAAAERDGKPGFTLREPNWPWSTIVARGAALLWERLLRRFPTHSEAFDAWCARVAEPSLWLEAPGEMTAAAREPWLDEAVVRVVTDMDLLGFSTELLKLQREDDYPFVPWTASEPFPGPGSSAAARYSWWQGLFAAHKGRIVRHDCRDPVDALAAALIRHDVFGGSKRIARLLAEGAERPHLAHAVPESILSHRPGALAWLIVRPETASLGLLLLTRLHLADDEAINVGIAPVRRRLRRLATLWAQTLEFAMDAIRRLPPADASGALLEVLLHLSEASSKVDPFRPELGEVAAWGATEMLDRALGLITETVLPYPINSVERPFLPTIAVHLLADLARATSSHRATLGRPPMAAWKLLFWLMEVASAGLAADARGGWGLAADAARTLARSYRRELERRREGPAGDETGSIVEWVDDRPRLAELPWHRVAETVVAGPALDDFLRPLDTATEEGPDRHGLGASDRANRRRSHLRILLKIHAGLRGRSVMPASDRAALRRRVEDEIAYAVTADRGADLFSAEFEGSGLGADTIDLLRRTVRAIDSFAPVKRRNVAAAWFAVEEEPAVLITAAAEMAAEETRQAILERLGKLDLGAALGEIETFRTVVRLARDAVHGGLTDVAGTILDWGDVNTQGTLFRPEWQRQAYSLRLALALLRGDEQAIAAMPSPMGPDAGADERAGLEESRGFYEALVAIGKQPDRAISILEPLIAKRPNSAALRVNLFAAQNELAALIEEPNTRWTTLTRALEEWQEVARALPPNELDFVEAHAAYNTLYVLAQTGRVDEFEARWKRLDPAIRYQPGQVRLAVATYVEQGRAGQAEAVLAEARAFHADAGPPPEWLAELEVKFRTGSTPEVAAAEPQRRTLEPTVENYRSYLADMRRLPPQEVAAIFGHRSSDSLGEFLLVHHVVTVEKLLILHMSIRKLDDEDKYSHLFAALLESRIAHLGWMVAEQSPGGQSGGAAPTGSRGGPGERDWVICGDGGRELAVSEALRIRTRSLASQNSQENIVWHAGRIFRYDAIGRMHAYVVAYVEVDDLDGVAADYQDVIRNATLPDVEFVDIRVRDELRAANLCILEATYRRSGLSTHVFHLLVRIPGAG